MVDRPTMNGRPDTVLAGVGLLTAETAGDVGAFGTFLTGSPVPVVLLLAGALLTVFSVAVVAYLGVGAVLETFITPATR